MIILINNDWKALNISAAIEMKEEAPGLLARFADGSIYYIDIDYTELEDAFGGGRTLAFQKLHCNWQKRAVLKKS